MTHFTNFITSYGSMFSELFWVILSYGWLTGLRHQSPIRKTLLFFLTELIAETSDEHHQIETINKKCETTKRVVPNSMPIFKNT